MTAVNQVSISGGGTPPPSPEVSPITVDQVAYISTAWTYKCRWDGVSGIVCPHTPAVAPDHDVPWIRNYAGVYGAAKIGGREILAIHGENKNEIFPDGTRLVNTVTNDETCFSGYANGGYQDCWQDYYGFASLRIAHEDKGPFLWPRVGYLRGDKMLCNGIRHPTLTRAERWLYAFYLDCSPLVETFGIAVARTPVDDLNDWKTWIGDGWEASLPKAANFKSRLQLRGPRAVSVISAGWFTVIQAGNDYLGLSEEEVTPTYWAARIYRSSDLVRWRSVGDLWHSPSWGELPFHYPRPLNAHEAIAIGPAGIVRVPIPQ